MYIILHGQARHIIPKKAIEQKNDLILCSTTQSLLYPYKENDKICGSLLKRKKEQKPKLF